MTNLLHSPFFYWALVVAIGMPIILIALTEWQRTLRRRQSSLVKPVTLLRNYLLPLSALLLMLVQVTQLRSDTTLLRTLSSLVAFGVLLLLLSGIKAALFQSAPEGTWRDRIPSIFVDLVRFLLIGIGFALIASNIWGANIKGVFTALGVTSIIVGLTLQNSVGQIISGLLMLFEQPFKLGDWINAPMAQGRVMEVNWRAVHLQTQTGLQIIPNSVLALASFTNLSRPPGFHALSVESVFAHDDPPDLVCAMLARTASDLPRRNPDVLPTVVPVGEKSYRTDIPLLSPNDDPATKAQFLRWIWYASRREGLRLNETADNFETPGRVAEAVHSVVTPVLRLSDDEEAEVSAHATLVRYGAGETISRSGDVPNYMTFIVRGVIRLTASNGEGVEVPVGVLESGAFLDQTVLTRQPVVGWARAVDQVTVVRVGREQIEDLVNSKPLLLEELGRAIHDRRDRAFRVINASTD
ncbi:MAG: mechanosensitive ion channel domain-containing protein [Mycobacterium sp.]